jgi:acetyltransferase-like isoleucine patch superfamily enzyme
MCHYFRIIRLLFFQRFYNLHLRLVAFFWGVSLGNVAFVYGRVFLRRPPKSRITIGENCRFLSKFESNLHGINRPCMISCLSRNSEVIIGDNCGFSGVIIASASSIKIGNRVMIGANCTISDTDSHSLNFRERSPKYYGLNTGEFKEDVKSRPIVIGDDVFIGMNTIVLKGVVIESGSVIGAGSVVTCNVPQNSIYAGNPAVFVRQTGFE